MNRRRWVLMVVLFALGAGYLKAQHAPTAEKNPLVDSATAPLAGKKTYEKACELCHGEDGGGGRGPALSTRNFRHGGEDWQLFQAISEGIPGTAMPSFGWLKPDGIWEVVTYLRTLTGAGPEGQVTGNIAAGEKIFKTEGGCRICHQVNGSGGPIGPDLSGIGQWNSKTLREFILNPNAGERVPDVVEAKTKQGQQIRGLRKNETAFSLALMDLAGEFRLLRKKDLTEIQYESKSLMPDDYGRRLSAEELQNLIAYLKTLRVRDLAQVAAAPLGGGVPYERIRDAHKEPQNWLTYWGDYAGTHFSSLRQITADNVKLLQAKWTFQSLGTSLLEATPLVVDGIMYTTAPSGHVYALDARSGTLLWQFQRRVKKVSTAGDMNRGVAILGERLFFTTNDAYLVAVDARTGRELWESEMADAAAGYGATMAPLALRDKIIAGISGAEYGVRGFLDAYDPASGKRLWRFHTVPGPGESGNDTWEGNSWEHGGGSTWMTGTYDPDMDLLYWGTGNPSPDLNGDVRKGDNLFTCSLIALEAATGRLKWHFQFLPHDTHDWDAVETPVLVNRHFHGFERKVVMQANRNAFFYVLNRGDGKFLLGKPFARQTWAQGLDNHGRPIPAPNSESGGPKSFLYPGLLGATNWQAPSYDPATGWLYVTFLEKGVRYTKQGAEYEPGKEYWGGRYTEEGREWGGLKAIDPETGKIEWEYKFSPGTHYAGVLATGGGVVFSASYDGNLMAFDSRAGRLLWHFYSGANIASSPMSYAVDGSQYVAISAGGVLYSFALPNSE